MHRVGGPRSVLHVVVFHHQPIWLYNSHCVLLITSLTSQSLICIMEIIEIAQLLRCGEIEIKWHMPCSHLYIASAQSFLNAIVLAMRTEGK